MKLFFSILKKIILLLISVLIFFLSHPNSFFSDGIWFLGYFIYLPVLFLIEKSSLKTVFLWGGLYGAFDNRINRLLPNIQGIRQTELPI